MSFIKEFYVVEDIRNTPLKSKSFTDFADALDCYVSIPNIKNKVFGIESRFGGRLYFVMCINGEDIITGDYANKKSGYGWNRTEVKEVNAALENYFQIKQNWPIITKARQESYECDILGFYDNIPELCGYRGRACKNLESRTGANSMLCHGCSLAVYCSTPTFREAKENHVKEDMFSLIDQNPEAEISDEALSLMYNDPTIGSRLVNALDKNGVYTEAYWESLLQFAEEEAKRYAYISNESAYSEEDIDG